MVPENVSRIEPCHLERIPPQLADLLTEVTRAAAVLGMRLHPRSAASLAAMVRMMNCYYSNLIEGHNTRPRDIERALADDLEEETERRNLQLEARAHVRLQEEIDRAHVSGHLEDPASVGFLRWVHRRFYEELPEAMRRVEGVGRSIPVVPGEFRTGTEHDVSVGRHQPPSSTRVEEFMAYFADRYRMDRMSASTRILAMATAHHRLNYIHPFPDGNGRVSRLMSHAMALQAGVGAHGLWSISRGLARGLTARGEYKRMMDFADTPRTDDYDGRGNLSLRALEEFTTWFLQVALDQISFMTSLFELDALAGRLRTYVCEHLGMKEAAALVLEEVLRVGELPRGNVSRVTGYKERASREVLLALVEVGLLASETPKGPVSLRFPDSARDVLFPRLFLAE